MVMFVNEPITMVSDLEDEFVRTNNDSIEKLFGYVYVFQQDESQLSHCQFFAQYDSETSKTKITSLQESRKDDTAIDSDQEHSSASRSSSKKRWGMDYHAQSRFCNIDIGRRRGSHSPDSGYQKLYDFTPIRTATEPKIDRLRDFSYSIASKRQDTKCKNSWSRSAYLPSTAKTLLSVITCILILLAETTSPGYAFSSNCIAEQCAGEFMRALDHDKVLIGSNLPYCTLLSNYGSCLNRTSRSCRGNLKFHSLNTMVMTQIRDNNCATLIEMRRKLGTVTKASVNGKPIKINVTTAEIPDEESASNSAGNGGRCLFPYQHQKGAGGYRYCSMFGDPHLRTFEGQYETCRTMGAWPLIDNSYFGVQVTNDPVADGVDASGISKVTVIVKSLPGCTDQKMFEATRDFLPSTFVDGTANSGDPNTNSISGASYYVPPSYDNRATDGEHRPAVVVRTMELDRHVEINLRYISTRIVIHRVGAYLTVAIKIPEEVLVQRTSLNTLQLCLTGCPSSERINYKEVLAYPEYYVRKLGVNKPAVNRDYAMDICRQTGVTDFFFDSCVFDLLMTGDESFKDSALAAMNDIRHLYPPYRKHYETRRSDLQLYDELAKLGRELEYEERQHGHKRRQPGQPNWDLDQLQDDESSSSSDHALSNAKARTSRTNNARLNSIDLPIICLLIVSTLVRHYAKW